MALPPMRAMLLAAFLSTTFAACGIVYADQGRFVDNDGWTVTDTKTGLMWEKQTSTCAAGEVTCAQDRYTWSDASPFQNPDGTLYRTFLKRLNQQPCFATHCDWRIPTIQELKTLSEPDVPQSVRVPDGIKLLGQCGVPCGYWSASSDTSTMLAWYAHPSVWAPPYKTRKTLALYARAVRGVMKTEIVAVR
jgi:hypothetical protein